MSGLKVFEHEMFGSVRVVSGQDDEPWFVAIDIAKSLGYENPAEAIRDHCKKVSKINHHSKTLPPTPPVNILIIPEGDIYRLVVRSKLPEAEKFEKWVMEEVLPSIRKTGSYSTTNKLAIPDFSNPAEAARAWANEYEAKQLALEEMGVQFKRNGTWLPHAKYANRDWFSIKQTETSNGLIFYNTRFTGKGREGIIKLFEKYDDIE